MNQKYILEKLQVVELFREFDRLQVKYGDKDLDAIYGAGDIKNPDICFVFMNPTSRNVPSRKSWKGLKAPWIGTKSVWRMFHNLGFFDKKFLKSIEDKKPNQWDCEFAINVYSKVRDKSIYITNLSKATQKDARPLKNRVFREYLNLFEKEMSIIKPKIIVSFGNQVSSILIGKNIKVSEYRKKFEIVEFERYKAKVFPVYYPVGQGMRNIKKAQQDIKWIINQSKI